MYLTATIQDTMDAHFVGKLRRDLCDWLKLSYDDALKRAKIEECKMIKFKHDDKYYKGLVYTDVHPNLLDAFDVELEFCETADQNDIWEYFRVYTSSVRTTRGYGRNIRILVKHKQSHKYLGIISLSGDVFTYDARDKYIGWTKEKLKDNLKYVMNITCCVGLQPMSFNLNLGKLFVALSFSKEVNEYFKEKYGHEIACITTFSINGKSIQYDRMPQYLKYVGETKGHGFANIPNGLYERCNDYLRHIRDTRTLNVVQRMYKINKVLQYLDIDLDEKRNNKPRGIYIGFTCPEAKDFLKGDVHHFTPVVKTVNEACMWWKDRWAKQRIQHLFDTNRIRHNIEFINAYKIYNMEKAKKCREKKIEELGIEKVRELKAEEMRAYRNRFIDIDDEEGINMFLQKYPVPIVGHPNPEWLAGFIDGDGSIDVCGNYKTPRLSIGQCDPTPLLFIQKYYGGILRHRNNTGKNARIIFNWTLSGRAVKTIANDIKDHVIIEKRNVDALIGWISDQELALPGDKYLDVLMSTEKKSHPSDHHRITDAYIAGLFDAEGEASLRVAANKTSGSYMIDITQTGDVELLKSVQSYLKLGYVRYGRFILYSKGDILNFIERMFKLTIVKQKSCDAIKKHMNKELALNEAVDIVQNEKHKEITIVKDLMDILNREGKSKAKRDNVLSDTPERQAAKKKTRQKQSEAKMGEKNPNFGVERSFEHSLGIKVGVALAKHSKRKVTDEQILDIRERHKKGDKVTTIAKDYGLSHQYISDIVKGKTGRILSEIQNKDAMKENLQRINEKVKLNEEKKSTLSTQELRVQNNVKARRKVKPELILTIMKYKVDNPKLNAPQIHKVFEATEGLSLAMTKNYVVGKVEMFKDEFPLNNITYEDFVSMKEKLSTKQV